MQDSEIHNRLNLIKSLISLEEFEQIQTQIGKLKNIIDDKQKITELENNFANKSYSKLIENIDKLINSQSGISLYQDLELKALKLELQELEFELNHKNIEFIEIEKLIHNFDLRQNNELGSIIEKILRFRKENLASQQKSNPKKQQEYEEAKFEYEEFNEQFENSKTETLFELNEEEKIEIKKLYRQASKLCHPDIVPEKLRVQAEEIFKKLIKAYEENDLAKVKEIFYSLKNGDYNLAKSDTINKKTLLKIEISKLRNILREIDSKIEDLKITDSYKLILQIEDIDLYFENTKIALLEELKFLQKNE